MVCDIRYRRTILIPQKVFIEPSDKSNRLIEMMWSEREVIVYFSFVFDFFELFLYERYCFFAESLPESAPPCEIVDRRSSVSTEVHPGEFGELFFTIAC